MRGMMSDVRALSDSDNDSFPNSVIPNSPQGGSTSELTSLALYGVIALGIALFIRFFVAAPFVVSGASMDPTFATWDYLIIDRVTYRLDNPARGDVVVFKFPQDTTRSFIKRVIGLPSETVVIENGIVRIESPAHPEGVVLTEPYIAAENMQNSSMRMLLGPDDYFVMGDNRRQSADSRTWGALPRDLIVGRALVRLFPFTEIGALPGDADFEN